MIETCFIDIEPVWFLKKYLSQGFSIETTCPPSEDSDQPWLAQSEQSLRYPHEETLGPYLPIERTAKTDQTRRMPRPIWVFAGRTVILLVLTCCGFNYFTSFLFQNYWQTNGCLLAQCELRTETLFVFLFKYPFKFLSKNVHSVTRFCFWALFDVKVSNIS